jgi:hypothetical protein
MIVNSADSIISASTLAICWGIIWPRGFTQSAAVTELSPERLASTWSRPSNPVAKGHLDQSMGSRVSMSSSKRP